jgi:uncharacterized protein with HEPN domain
MPVTARRVALWVLRRAVEHGLLIISETAKTLPAEVKDAAPDIAWRKIETLGNFMRREYRDVDADLIWSITQENLQALSTSPKSLRKSSVKPRSPDRRRATERR